MKVDISKIKKNDFKSDISRVQNLLKVNLDFNVNQFYSALDRSMK